jgi:predicted RNA-binding Zn-ribbon protein involved in translation (DUF1610 family)
MGAESQRLKKCPSCGSGIDGAATMCPLCGTAIVRCAGCGGWSIAGATCPKCGKGTAIRARQAAAEAAPAAAADAPKIEIDAEPLYLLPILLVRLLLLAASGGAIVLAIAASPFGRVTTFVRDHGVGVRTGAPMLWGAAAGFLLLVVVAGSVLRRFRLRHTEMFGAPVKVRWGLGALTANLLIALFLGPLTAGVAVPWLVARFRQAFYRTCVLPSRGDRTLDFEGRGEQVLGRIGLSLLLLPLAVASGGLLLGLISWIWVKWEQSNLVVPDRNGRPRGADFFGSFWGYQARWIWGWLLTLLTAGIYRSWAKVAEWKWIARHTQVG